ncbi:helix-turn-helix domain-containing protein [Gracilibacillus marinus]|jgi:transcriptional regulator with XRE-family HTH domain|uniref:Helix-turn-helix domain-containing protein n=1 Tax=Gracilibacillus marinus TaxID=630535 RepID=A0ABV8W259_9BACI
MATNKWGRRIKAFRKLKGYTQIDFAKKIGMSVSQLGDIERGHKVPSDETLAHIANHLGISVEELAPKSEA